MRSQLSNISAGGVVRLSIVLGFVLVLGAGLPGHMSTDSVIQLFEGRTGVSQSFNPPFMSWLLGTFDALVPGTGLFVAFNVLLLFASLYALTYLQDRLSWLTVPTALLMFCTPQILIYQAIVWKDVLFANLAIAGFVCLAYGVQRWAEPLARLPWLLASILLLALACLTRQNGVLVLLAAAVALGVVAGGRRLGRFAAYGAGTLLAGLLLIMMISAFLGIVFKGDKLSGTSGSSVGLGRILQQYDIVGIVANDPQVNLSILDAANSAVDDKVRADAAIAYSPERVDTLSQAPEMSSALATVPAEAISQQWLALITSDTGPYLRHRWAVFRKVMFTPELVRCLPVWVGVSGPPDKLSALGLREEMEPQDVALFNYATYFYRTPVYSHLTFAIIAVVISILLLLRRRPTDIVMVAMLLSALAFAASFFLLSLACDYRYLYFLDLATMVGLFYLITNPSLRRLRRSARGTTTQQHGAEIPPIEQPS